MKIINTDCAHFNTQILNDYERHVYHNVAYKVTAELKGLLICIGYQTSDEYAYCNNFEPTDMLIENCDFSGILGLCESDFEEGTEEMTEILNEINSKFGIQLSESEFFDLYVATYDNTPILDDVINTKIYTDNIDDYIINEFGDAALKIQTE